MPVCESLEKCIFFNDKMAAKPATAELLKQRYCLGEKTGCARYKVKSAFGPENVPADLFPNQTERANALLAR